MSKPRILMLQPSLRPPGGGNGVCAWMLEALRDDYDLTLLAWDPVDLDEVNQYFGTSLRTSDVTILQAGARTRSILERLPLPISTLKASLIRRQARTLAQECDLVMTANNEADFGRPGIQYVHYPVRHVAALPSDLRWYHRPWTMAAYESLWSLISPFDDDAMRANLTLVNSAWTGRLVTAAHGIPVRVVHPPAPGAFAPQPWSDREDGFLCIGRLSPEKNIEHIIEMVRRVRVQRPAAHLHIVGSDDHPTYVRHLREAVRQAGPWVTLEGTLRIDALQRLLGRHRYVIHGMRDEHFGMAVAQAVRAGCIVFVPDSGGQVEIVGDEPSVRYDSLTDGVEKILGMMTDATLQRDVGARLAERAHLFTPARFMTEIRTAVRDALAGRTAGAPVIATRHT